MSFQIQQKGKMPDLNSSHVKEKKLYLGMFHPFLEDSLCSEIERVRDQDRLAPIIVLVGSNLLGLYLRRVLAQKLGFLFNVRFLTFIDLARTLATERMIAEGKYEIPTLSGKLIIEKCLKKKEGLKYFSDMVPYKGFKDALLNTIEDLKEAGISASDFNSIVQRLKKKGTLYRTKLQELSKIYGRYSAILKKKNLYDRSDLILEAIKLMGQDESLLLKAFNDPRSGKPAFFIYGFYDFNFIQRALLNECMQVSDCIAFSPYKKTAAYHFAKTTRSWFRDLGFQVTEESKVVEHNATQLDQLKKRLFSNALKPSGDLEKDGTFEIISAPGETREVREILRAMTSLISEGIKLSDIGLFIRTSEGYIHLLQESFDRNSIRYYSPSSFPLSQTREGRSLLLFLSLIGSDYSRSAVMEFLNLADLDFAKLFKGSHMPSITDWDLISKEAGIISGKKEWMKRLKSCIKNMKEYGIVDESGEKVRKDSEKIKEAERFLKFMQVFFLEIESIPLEGKWSELSRKMWESYKRWVRETEALKTVEQALEELNHLERINEKTTLNQFLECLREQLNSSAQKKGKFQSGGVTISNLATSRGIGFKIIIAPGLVEKEFPIVIRQDPILLDADREKINGLLSEKRLALKMNRIEEEKLLFDLLVSSAKEKLILTFPRINPDTAAERVPSFFLLQSSEALTGEKVDYENLDTLPFFARTPLSQLFPRQEACLSDELEYDLKLISNAIQSKKKSDAYFLQDCSPFFKKALMAECSRWGKRTFTPYDGVLNDPTVLDTIRKMYSVIGNSVSATSLERYAACPFQYFCEKILRLSILEEPEKIMTISPLEKGWLIHAILFEFFEHLKKEKEFPWKREHLESYLRRLDQISKKRFEGMELTGRTGFSMMWDIEKDSIMKDLREMIKIETEKAKDFIPSHFEVRFGMPGGEELEGAFSSDSPVLLDLNNGRKIFLKGRIDRIDLSEDQREGIVIDYKTGMARHKNNSFMGGQSLQLPIYIFVAEHLLMDHLKIDVALDSAEYFYVTKKGDFKRKYFDKSGWEQKLETLKKIIQIISDGIERGVFFQVDDETICRYCDYSLICGTAIDLKFQRKKNDPLIKSYLEMSEIS